MSAPQGCTDHMDVVGKFTEALTQRIGADRFRMWFGHNVTFLFEPGEGTDDRGKVVVQVVGQFALDRLQKNFMSQLRGSAMQACGSSMDIDLRLHQPKAQQASLPMDGAEETEVPTKKRRRRVAASSVASDSGRRGKTTSLAGLVNDSVGRTSRATSKQSAPRSSLFSNPTSRKPLPGQMSLPGLSESSGGTDGAVAKTSKSSEPASGKDSLRASMTMQTFVGGSSNKLAVTAATMVCETPGVASPLFLCGPTGTGKTHLLCAIASQLRRRHRMRRVVHLSAEQFTNDFIASVSNSGITAFRSRYRDIDALLIDDIQFLGSKKATLRELLYTIETLSTAGRPLIFSGLRSPTETQGLTAELAGRMAAGLVCPLGPLDNETRQTMLSRLLTDRCPVEIGDDLKQQLSSMVAGDGRVIGGLVNSVSLLARMHGRAPTIDEVRTLAGDVLRSAKTVTTLSVIESAVCEAFQLPGETLRGGAQTRSITEPRMLAMYLARQMTSSAYAEIARHFGGKSHSTAIAAEKNVQKWLNDGKAIGRGHATMSTREALNRVENLLRAAS